MSRQNFYKKRKRREAREVDEGLILNLVKRERQIQPRIGCRKLRRTLRPELQEAGVTIGRDRLIELLRREELLVPPLPKAPRTTDSRCPLPLFKNEIMGIEPKAPLEIWVSDLTYIRTSGGFSYLSLIMDRFSRKIVGYHCGQTLEAETCIKALDQAIAGLSVKAKPIHHSDRGGQYRCFKYVEKAQSRGMTISMTEDNHCYENAHAERVIGILKQEYGLGKTFRNHKQLCKSVDQAIWLYNNKRLHKSLDYKTPSQVHDQAA